MEKTSSNLSAYTNYLRGRTFLANIYRRIWLYPRLNRYLHGPTIDVGCGIGDFLAYRKDTIGVDINNNTVDFCKSRGLNALLIQNDNLPFGTGSFQSALLDNVIEHVADPHKLLTEIQRILSPDGTLVVGVPGLRGYIADQDHKVFYGKRKLRKVIETHGFTQTDIFFSPLVESQLLSKYLRAYCTYAIFKRNS